MTNYRRTYRLAAGRPGEEGLAWEDSVAIRFEVVAKRRGTAEATITLLNLSRASIGHLEQPGAVVQLSAGYVGARRELFTGVIRPRGVTTQSDGTDVVTEIKAKHAALEVQNARAAISLAPGSTSAQALAQLADAMGVGRGNTGQLDAITYRTGYVATGRARDLLEELADDLGRAWTIQDGALYLLAPGDDLGREAPLLRPGSGLIGRVQQGRDGVELSTQLDGRIVPGGAVQLESDVVSGVYVAREVTHVGDWRGGDWVTNVRARAR